jgi:hypothetical protein
MDTMKTTRSAPISPGYAPSLLKRSAAGGTVWIVAYRPRSWSLSWSNLRPLLWAALGVLMITIVVGATEHDLRWGDGAGLATVIALVAAKAMSERRSGPGLWVPLPPVSRAAALTVAGVLTPIWLIDFVVMGIVRADAGTYTPGGLILVYAVGAMVAVLWVAALLAVLWAWTSGNRSSTEPPLAPRSAGGS